MRYHRIFIFHIQQYAILFGALTSAVAIGGILLLMNEAGTHYTRKGVPQDIKVTIPADPPREKPGRPYNDGALKDDPNLRTIYHQIKRGTINALSVGGFFKRASPPNMGST